LCVFDGVTTHATSLHERVLELNRFEVN